MATTNRFNNVIRFLFCAVPLVLTAQNALAATTAAEILEPKDGAKLARLEQVVGRLRQGGWPVIVVRSLEGEADWAVLPEVRQVAADGTFSAAVPRDPAQDSPWRTLADLRLGGAVEGGGGRPL